MSEKKLSRFEKWLGESNLQAEKTEFIEQHKELFHIVFEAGKQEAKDEVTFSGIDVFHDVVVDTTDLDLNNNQLKELFYYLPEWLQSSCERYGMYDLKDDIYVYFEKNGLPSEFQP